MNILLLALFLTLAWVPWGEAGDDLPLSIDLKGHVGPGAPLTTESAPLVYLPAGIKPNGILQAIILDRDGYVKLNPCLAKMEAAMRAMEPFSIYEMAKRTAPWPKYEDYKVIQQQWNAVKRECWKEWR